MRDAPRVLVTGATAGIGRGVATRFAERGHPLTVCARSESDLQQLLDVLPGTGHRAVPVDLAVRDDVLRFGEALGSESILVAVHCAGGSVKADLDSTPDLWDDAIELMFHAPRLITEQTLPHMRKQGWGRVVLMGGALEPGPTPNAGAAAKAALMMWAKGFANAVARDGITVNTINPGRINSRQVLERLHPDPDQRRTWTDQHVPIGYFGEPADVASLTTFLASEEARYITGTVIHVDGGLRKWPY